MFENLRARWNAARQRRFQARVAKYVRTHFSEVIGSDDEILDLPDGLEVLHQKYFGGGSGRAA
ncbi:MAG: hypothetical protein ACYTKD_16710 [Planctomycetota bacterium]|jgi:hypothetical protein